MVNSALLFAVGFVLWLLVHRLVVRPLSQFSAQVTQLAENTPSHAIDPGQTDVAEIITLQQGFNQLMMKIGENQAKITEQNAVLEQRVNERTHELNIKNAELLDTIVQKAELAKSLSESQSIAGLGNYALIIPTGFFDISDVTSRLFGIDDTYDHSVEGWKALIHPDDCAMVIEHLKNDVIGRGETFDMEYRIFRHDDQAERWMHGLGRLIYDAHGSPLKMLGTVQDVTERKKSEGQITDLLAFNQTIINKTPYGMAVFKAEGPCVMANEAYALSIGGTVEGVLKQNFRHTVSWKRHGLFAAAINALETDQPTKVNFEGETSFGKDAILECAVAPIRISGVPHIVVMVHDIMERIKAVRALSDSLQQLEKKELAKTRFLAAAGHDLRQPLTAANLYISALKLSEPTARQDNIIQRLEQSMEAFKGLLDALLNVSKLDAGMIKPEYTLINVPELIIWLEQNFAAVAKDKQLDFKLYFPMKRTLFVRSDIGLIKSVLMNLVSNAIKFTTEGAILVSARQRGSCVLFQVWDTGIGIPEEYIEHIFDEFYQIDNPQRDRTSGLGLGLSIVKRALALLNTQIRCKSQSGRGTVFEFSLPLAEAVAPSADAITFPHKNNVANNLFAAGKKFIVVEDDTLVAQGMIAWLEGMGGEVTYFNDAEDALLHADIEFAGYYIVDYMLGGALSGIQFLNKLSQKSDEPIIAVLMTGDTSSDFIRESAGFDWPVQFKPVNASELLSSLQEQENWLACQMSIKS
jgi:PAS domain S-box-containing protein